MAKQKRPSSSAKHTQPNFGTIYHPWDKRMKRLFRQAPQDIVSWLMPGATFVSMVNVALDSEEFYPDILCEVELNGTKLLLHVEFQRHADPKMLKRLWRYNVMATVQYDCDVWSVVIYLQEEPVDTSGTMIRRLSTGRLVHHFECDAICLWTLSLETLKGLQLAGLSPLYVLCQEGPRREVVEETITELMAEGEAPQTELLALAYGLASLAFQGQEADQQWLVRRFAMLYDILKETPAYQELIQEGHQAGLEEGLEKGLVKGLEKGLVKGLEKGRQEGRAEGKLEGMREVLLSIVQVRFPQLSRLTKRLASGLTDARELQQLTINISQAQTLEQARHLLDEIIATE